MVLATHEHEIAMNAHRILHVRDGKVERDEILKKEGRVNLSAPLIVSMSPQSGIRQCNLAYSALAC